MQKLRGLLLASVTLCAGGAQAFQLNTPTIHQVSPQSLPLAGGAGKVDQGSFGVKKPMDSASPKLSHPPNPCKGCAQVDYF
jgi:hypothetical protein